MERIGLFSETGYISLGDRYPKVDPRSRVFNEAAYKGKQMLPGGSKTRSALQAGYFEGGFKRIMEKEAYTDSIKMRRHDRLNQNKKNISSKPFYPSSFTKKRSGLGNHYGTFSGTHVSFSPNLNASKPYVTPGRNFTTTPGKKGTGFGYVNVTFQQYHEHSKEPYDRARDLRRIEIEEHKKKLKGGSFKLGMHPKALFDQNIYRSDRSIKAKEPPAPAKKVTKTPFRPSNPGKKIAGCKAGTFEAYPKHSEERYTGKPIVVADRSKNVGIKGIFHPSPGPKSTPTKSVLDENVTKVMNRNNFKTVKTVMAF